MNKDTILRGLRQSIAPLLAENNMKEQEALLGYYRLRDHVYNWCREQSRKPDNTYDRAVEEFWIKYCKDLIDDIEEVISDELNHSEKWLKNMVKFGMVKPAED